MIWYKRLSFVLCICFITVLLGCAKKEDQQNADKKEKIPNSLEKATSEVEQLITLLNGPMFDTREKVEQLKKEQMQILITQSVNCKNTKNFPI